MSIQSPYGYLFAKLHPLITFDSLITASLGLKSRPNDLEECFLITFQSIFTALLRVFEICSENVWLWKTTNAAYFVSEIDFKVLKETRDNWWLGSGTTTIAEFLVEINHYEDYDKNQNDVVSQEELELLRICQVGVLTEKYYIAVIPTKMSLILNWDVIMLFASPYIIHSFTILPSKIFSEKVQHFFFNTFNL